MIYHNRSDANLFGKPHPIERMRIKPRVYHYEINRGVSKIRSQRAMQGITEGQRIPTPQRLEAGQTNYLNPFWSLLAIFEVEHVVRDHNRLVSLTNKLFCKMLGVFFDSSDIRQIIRRENAKCLFHTPYSIKNPDR